MNLRIIIYIISMWLTVNEMNGTSSSIDDLNIFFCPIFELKSEEGREVTNPGKKDGKYREITHTT